MMNVSQKNFKVDYITKSDSGKSETVCSDIIRAYSERQLESIIKIKLELKNKKLVTIKNVKRT